MKKTDIPCLKAIAIYSTSTRNADWQIKRENIMASCIFVESNVNVFHLVLNTAKANTPMTSQVACLPCHTRRNGSGTDIPK
jgi:hypothetical protein